ncbi:hypothetical protein NP493_130g04012, partial [Ridgeia piscesae]
VKVIVINEQLQGVFEASVTFDADLPEFKTEGGVHVGQDCRTVTSPTPMWVKAADLLLQRMKDAKFNFSQVAALSGTAQQHGSVYWGGGVRDVLRDLHPDVDMHTQLKNCFSVPDSPVWMDASTTEQCRHLEEALGGAEASVSVAPVQPSQLTLHWALAGITGMRAFERMTGNQIAKIYQTNQAAYSKTEACAPDLEDKLGHVVPAYECIGGISPYMADRYGFSLECRIIAFTGDNPGHCSSQVSLGTSDTLLLWLREPRLCLEGLNLVNPVDSSAYMSLVCFKNGSRTRERICEKCTGASWDRFDEVLVSTPPGNNGSVGPHCRLLATGGASCNKSILQVLADVFLTPVYIQDVANSACLGSAYRAKHGRLGAVIKPSVSQWCIPKQTNVCKNTRSGVN